MLGGLRSSITNRSIRDAESELEVFLQLFPLHLVQEICLFSNSHMRAHFAGQECTIAEFQPEEILKFIGLLIAQSVHRWGSGIARNGSVHGNGVFPAGTFSRFMSRNRCKQIVEFLHFCDNSTINQTDKFAKIRLLLDTIREKIDKAFQLGTRMAMDEGMWPTKSRYAPNKVKIKSK